MSDQIETMGNPSGDQALSVSDAAQAFRNLNVRQAEEAQAEEQPEAKPEPAPQEQAPEPEANASVEGDDPPEPQADDKTKRYRVKHDGVESQVSFEELRNGYQRNLDYQAKMRKVAESQQQADAQRQAYLDRINQFVPQLEAAVMGEFADIKTVQDVSRLAESDPSRYVKWQAAQMALQQANAERQRAQHDAQQRQAEQLKSYLDEQHKQLSERLPEWSDPEKGQKLKSDLRRYLKSEGFSDDEVGQMADHRHVLVVRKAMLFDAAQKQRAQAAQAVQNVPKVQKPGTTTKSDPKGEATQAAFDRLRKTGKAEDAVSVFKGLKLFS